MHPADFFTPYFSAYWVLKADIFCPLFCLTFAHWTAIFYRDFKFWSVNMNHIIICTVLNVLSSLVCIFCKSIGQTIEQQNQMGKTFINGWERFLIFNNFTLMMCLLGVRALVDYASARLLWIPLYPYYVNQMHVEWMR